MRLNEASLEAWCICFATGSATLATRNPTTPRDSHVGRWPAPPIALLDRRTVLRMESDTRRCRARHGKLAG